MLRALYNLFHAMIRFVVPANIKMVFPLVHVQAELYGILGEIARSSGAVLGTSFDDTADACDAFDNQWQPVHALQTPQCFCGGLNELEVSGRARTVSLNLDAVVFPRRLVFRTQP